MTKSSESKHLTELLSKRSGSAEAQIVFTDIVSYSKRKSTMQKSIIDRFQIDFKEALTHTGREFIDHLSKNDNNVMKDTITIATGDGAAAVFTFSGIQTIALEFGRKLMSIIHEKNSINTCEIFEEHNWCNCHNHYKLRVSVSEGKCIIFEDMNGNVNVAGTAVNDAARILNVSEPENLLIDEKYYTNLIDMSEDPTLDAKIMAIGKVSVKHGKLLNIFQYVGENEFYISRNVPVALQINNVIDQTMEKLGIPKPIDSAPEDSKLQMLNLIKTMGGFMESMQTKKIQ